MIAGTRGAGPSLVAVSAILCAACGSKPPPPAAEPAPEESHEVKPLLKTKSELGTVDPDAVSRAFRALDDKFDACQQLGLGRVEVLAGSLKFFLRIGEDGTAKWTYFEDSDLGDRQTEKCLLDAVMGATWPKPDGGDAEARYTMELPAQGRPATDWNPDKVAAALGKHGGAIDDCKSGSSASFKGTLYVAPGGKVIAAGVSTSTKDGADKLDCLAQVLVKMKGLPSPGSWPAKVTVGL
jgi:hypothetical protein